MKQNFLCYPFLLFIKLELDTVFEYGGLTTAQSALKSWPDNFKARFKYNAANLFTTEELQDSRVIVTTDTFVLRTDAEFGTVASLLKKLESVAGRPESVRVNGAERGAGHWLRPGDRVEIFSKIKNMPE